MRILCFVNASDLSDPARAALAFASALRSRGEEVLLVGSITARQIAESTQLGRAADELGVSFRLIQRRSRLDPGVMGQFTAILARFKPESLCGFGSEGLWTGVAARLRSVRWSIVIVGRPPWILAGGGPIRRCGRWIRIAVMRRAEACFVESPEIEAQLHKSGVNAREVAPIRIEMDLGDSGAPGSKADDPAPWMAELLEFARPTEPS